jgi:hypothetical protein
VEDSRWKRRGTARDDDDDDDDGGDVD